MEMAVLSLDRSFVTLGHAVPRARTGLHSGRGRFTGVDRVLCARARRIVARARRPLVWSPLGCDSETLSFARRLSNGSRGPGTVRR
jgi:hypothetical protein